MITKVPSYYKEFRCIADRCRHTCCAGWEIDVEGETLPKYLADGEIAPHLCLDETPHILLEAGERCPFLQSDGLCHLIITRGEDSLCQICRDHPRFRNFWTDREEIGLGMVCEEAARLILSQHTPLTLETLSESGGESPLPSDEQWLYDLRQQELQKITETGPRARLKEYLIFRHLANALYDGMVEERLCLIGEWYAEILSLWGKTDGTLPELAEAVRSWSYDNEYDDEVIEKRLLQIEKRLSDN